MKYYKPISTTSLNKLFGCVVPITCFEQKYIRIKKDGSIYRPNNPSFVYQSELKGLYSIIH